MSDSKVRMRRQKQETGAQCQQYADKRRHSVQGPGGEGGGGKIKVERCGMMELPSTCCLCRCLRYTNVLDDVCLKFLGVKPK